MSDCVVTARGMNARVGKQPIPNVIGIFGEDDLNIVKN
jgi:hypothetical protein